MKRRRLGQHYLVSEEVVDLMVREAAIGPGEKVLEIGTGKGALTRKLFGAADAFEGFEVDTANFKETADAIPGIRGFLHREDAFRTKPSFDVLVSSLPYSQSANFIGWLAQRTFKRAVVLLQSDFAAKATSAPGTRDYRAVSALTQICFDVTIPHKVPRTAFDPRPRVDSVVLSIKPRLTLSASQISWVRRFFSLRRQSVPAALKKLGIAPRLEYGGRRVYSLTPAEVVSLCPAAGR